MRKNHAKNKPDDIYYTHITKRYALITKLEPKLAKIGQNHAISHMDFLHTETKKNITN